MTLFGPFEIGGSVTLADVCGLGVSVTLFGALEIGVSVTSVGDPLSFITKYR